MDDVKGPLIKSSLKNFKCTSLHVTKPTSLSTLVVWNVSKALEKSPTLDIKEAITSAQIRLERVSNAGDIQSLLSESPYERHMACALLAWQQLGHQDADSLCRFVESRTKREKCPSKPPSIHEPFELENMSRTSRESKASSKIVSTDIGSVSQDSGESVYEEANYYSSFATFPMGPVVKLPVETKVVMRLENTQRGGRPSGQGKKPRAPERDIITRIDQACCMDSECAERLAAMDATSAELRARAGTLARREAERIELLERAEAAWKDLELGYQRRLALAEEKEEDIAKQIAKILEERVNCKNACTNLAVELKDRSGRAEVERTRLGELERAVCERACQRMRASEESARADAAVAEQACRAAQLDRDLQFKEEQARRNLLNMKGELQALRALTCEAERATRTELGALRDQITDVSSKLLAEDLINENIKLELEDLRQEKMEIIEDLDGCKALCDGRTQERLDVLVGKRKQLAALREKVMECRCKVPVDIAVEVKRTPSLAALCKCSPEDKILECCSCTSMRTRLLSNLFADLFGGLQAELGGAVTAMPCQLLKCLEDKHNWDRASAVKSNLKNYFSQLLVGELDIAIATSVENYHAKWVGISCADVTKMTPGPGDDPEREGWQERAIERRAQKLASQLADQLFQERAEELTQRARDIVQAGPPPCECDLKAKLPEGCCCGSMHPPTPATVTIDAPARSSRQSVADTDTQVFWHQAIKDVTQLRLQVEDLRKDSIKKEDLKTMENTFQKFINLSSIGGPPERDFDGLERKSVKKAGRKLITHGKDAKKHDDTGLNISNKGSGACSCVVNNPLPTGAITPKTPASWQQAMQEVTLLRSEIEDLKKESIKREDLKKMENKIAKIINRASDGTSFHSKMNYTTDRNSAYETNKYSKINRSTNQPGLHISYADKPIINKKKLIGSIAKDIKLKPILNNGVNKSYKRNSPAYAVNLCLCSTKRQEQKELNDKRKAETNAWKQKCSKDTMSQMSSSIRQSMPINNSFLSEDISAETYSKEYDEESCPSNCVCFHKIPSNTSIDKLLDTLAKWKGDLDASFTEKYPIKTSNFVKSNEKYPQEEKLRLDSKTSLISKLISPGLSTQKKLKASSYHGSDKKINLQQLNTKLIGQVSAKQTEPAATTDSVYMGAVNLDKSHEDICKCNNGDKVFKKTPYKCIPSNKCSCEKTLQLKNINDKISHVIKEKQNEITPSVIRTKQERRVKDTTSTLPKMPDTPINTGNNKIQSLKQELNTTTIDKKTETRPIGASDFQIHFLGVTLVDVNPQSQNQTLSQNDRNFKNTISSNDVTHEKFYSDNLNIAKNIAHYKQQYLGRSAHSVSGLTTYTKGTVKNNVEIVTAKDFRNDDCNHKNTNYIDGQDKCQIYNEIEDNNNFKKRAMLLSYMGGSDLSQLHKNIKYKNSDLGYKTASDQDETNKGCENYQYQIRNEGENANLKNSQGSDISKKSYKTASENYQSFDKPSIKSNNVGNVDKKPEVVISKNHSTLSNQDITLPTSPRKISCECSTQLEEFKKFVNANFTKQSLKEDVALDVQSLKHFKERDESCVCCSKLNNEECRDLEDNTFHLLEEYLKKKFNDFKESNCSSLCIPAKEEEKIFSIIVQRVKRLISDSTNQVACKCSADDGKAQGSWNRAYGLLQEYLRIKIKKVQCSCLLAEDNKDTILPDVLEKISSLIEYDFQRLKNIFSCINGPNIQENKNNNGKQVNFDVDYPEKEQSSMFQTKSSRLSLPLDDQISPYQGIHANYLKQSTISQLPLNFAMDDDNNCNLKKTDLNNSIHSIHKHWNHDSRVTDPNNESKNCTKKTNQIEPKNSNELVEDVLFSKSFPSNFENILHSIDLVNELASNSCNKIGCQNDTISISSHSLKNGEEIKSHEEHSNLNSSGVPYFGYTITCSCDKKLGPCTCPKNISKNVPDTITDLWNKSMPDESFFEKISYILPKQPVEYINDDIKLHKKNKISKCNIGSTRTSKKKLSKKKQKSEATCCIKLEPMVLKTSRSDVATAHVETNTFKDNVSVDTDCSNNEDIEWCECTSEFNSCKHADCNRLKRSIYYPAAIEDAEEPKSTTSSASCKLQRHVCNCERVPICHVKMLVENIENKLANANCTCDSLIPKVCPVHSNMC